MSGKFGDKERFQFNKLMEQRIRGAMQLAKKQYYGKSNVMPARVQLFIDNLKPIECEDDGRVPGGSLEFHADGSRCNRAVKAPCYEVAMRSLVKKWWSFVKNEKPADDEFDAIEDAITAFELLVRDYEKAVVEGSIDKGYYLTVPEKKKC